MLIRLALQSQKECTEQKNAIKTGDGHTRARCRNTDFRHEEWTNVSRSEKIF